MCSLVTVIIPTYNRANDLKRAVDSVLKQTYQCFELLIVDNYSDDGTDDYLQTIQDQRVQVYKIHNEGVISVSRNVGLAKARGVYVAYLDSDDWWKPDKLSKSVEALDAGADFVYHPLHLITKPGQHFYWRMTRAFKYTLPVYDDLLSRGSGIATSSVVTRKVLLDQVGGMTEDKKLIASEDYDTWLSIARLTDRFYKLNTPLGYYWAVGSNYWFSSDTDKLISKLEYLELRYVNDIKRLGFKEVYWFSLAKTMICYRNGEKSKAQDYLKTIDSASLPLRDRIKLFYLNIRS